MVISSLTIGGGILGLIAGFFLFSPKKKGSNEQHCDNKIADAKKEATEMVIKAKEKTDSLKAQLEQASQKSKELEKEDLKKEKEAPHQKEAEPEIKSDISEKDSPEKQRRQEISEMEKKLKTASNLSKEIEWDIEREK